MALLRDYSTLIARAPRGGDRAARMQGCVDLIWEAFGNRPYSWIGFYSKTPDADEMLLERRRDKPACSPIGLQGMCGRSWREGRPILVNDVRTLGANYIACDPRDLSEIVVPCMNAEGTCWGVLDGDSYETGAFDQGDVEGLTRLVEAAGLSEARALASTLSL